MASISQSLFSWQAVESSSEILRFQRIVESLDDEDLMRRLRRPGRGRRPKAPIEAMWHSLLAGLVFGHATIESLRRELMRNAELRQACGFDPILCERAVPDKDAYSRFIAKLARHEEALLEVFHRLVERLGAVLEDFGRYLAADGKAIPAARKDDAQAGVGVKRAGHPDGAEGEEVTYRWFGYKLHMLCDARYELPVAFRVTNASEHESPHLRSLVEETRDKHEALLARTQALCADKGYDDGADKAWLYDEYGVAPVIPARQVSQGKMTPLDETVHDAIYVSDTGQVACKTSPFAPGDAERFTPMQFMGFEKRRRTLKFRCPAAAYGVECKNRDACRCRPTVREGAYGRVVRVAIDRNPRIFGPLYQHSYRFEDLYKMRTSVERLFFRFDHMYGFERHQTRGLARMRVRVALALIAMQATAVGWIQAGQAHHMRRLRPAA
jgi:hypothetical protein